MLWCDQTTDLPLEGIVIDNDLTHKLLAISKHKIFTHLILYGNAGCGKRTKILAFLKNMYNFQITKNSYLKEISVTSNKRGCSSIWCICSPYHVEILPDDEWYADVSIFQSIITIVSNRTYLTKKIINAKNEEPIFRCLLVRHFDRISMSGQMALRQTMETCVDRCKIIATCQNIDLVHDAIKSRCICMRARCPTDVEILSIVNHSLAKNGKRYDNILPDELKRIICICERNMKHILLEIQLRISGEKENVPTWKRFIKDLTFQHFLYFEKNYKNILKSDFKRVIKNIRIGFYVLLSKGIHAVTILKEFLNIICEHIDRNDIKLKLLEYAAYCDISIIQGHDPIFYLEYFVINAFQIISLFRLYNDNSNSR